MKTEEIINLCEKSDVTLKTTVRNIYKPVRVKCNKCDSVFAVTLNGVKEIECKNCSSMEQSVSLEENLIVKIEEDVQDVVVKTEFNTFEQ